MTAKSIQKSYTADEAIGITVNQLMFTHRVTRKMLGDALGISGQTLGRKVRGQISWSLAEIFAIAAYFNIEVTDLLPRRVPQMQETPGSLSRTEGSNLVAGVGFEPTTSGSVAKINAWHGSLWRYKNGSWQAQHIFLTPKTAHPHTQMRSCPQAGLTALLDLRAANRVSRLNKQSRSIQHQQDDRI